MRMGAEGIKVLISGRLNGAEMVVLEMYKEGRTRCILLEQILITVRQKPWTKVGLLGIKLWICR